MIAVGADRDGSSAWSEHPIYGLIHPVPSEALIFDNDVMSALSDQNCEYLSLVTPVTARVYDRSNMERLGIARLLTIADGRTVVRLGWP